MQTYYKNTSGILIALAIKDDGVPVDLTTCTVALKLYSFTLNTLKWSHTCTIDDATNGLAHYTTVSTDFDTVGDYYSIVIVTKTGYSMTYVDESYKIIENQQSTVTPAELLKFMDIPEENAKATSTIQMYIDQAQSLLMLEVPVLTTTTSQKYIDVMQKLIMLRGATIYFLNSGESNINPDIRMQKIKLWSEEYKLGCDRLNAALSTSAVNSSGSVRRMYNVSVMPSPLSENYSPYSKANNTDND